MAKPTMNADTYQQILAMLADGRRQTANMVRNGRRGDLTDLTATERAHLEMFGEAYASVDDIERFLREGK